MPAVASGPPAAPNQACACCQGVGRVSTCSTGGGGTARPGAAPPAASRSTSFFTVSRVCNAPSSMPGADQRWRRSRTFFSMLWRYTGSSALSVRT